MPSFLLTLLLFSGWSLAHQSTTTAGGNPIFWTNKQIPLVINSNSLQMDNDVAHRIISDSITEWNKSSTTKLNAVSSGNNEIKFTKDFAIFGSAVLGLTEVTYNNSGVIQKATVLINDNFTFSSSPGSSFLGDVITHELGHLFGLAHSEVLNSSMFYASYPGQSTVAADDQASIRSKYDDGFGKILGSIKGGNQIGIMGVHVQAVSLKSGQIVSTISLADGSFALSGLEVGDTFYLYTSPLKKLDSLAPYLANVQTNFCPSAYVGSFFNACGKEHEGLPQPIMVTSQNPVIQVGTVTINCSLKTNADYDYEKLFEPFGEVSIFNYGDELRSEKAFVGYFKPPSSDDWQDADKLLVDLRQFYQLEGYPKYLKLQLISQPLGTRLEFELRLRRVGSSSILLQRNKLFSSDGTYVLDLEGLIPLSSEAGANFYQIEIKAKRLDTAASFPFFTMRSFPAYASFSSGEYLPYLLMVSLWEGRPAGLMPMTIGGVKLSDNSSCLDAPFSYAVTKTLANSRETRTPMQDQNISASCGSITPSGGQGGGSSGLMIMSLAFMFSLITAQLMKKAKKFLS